jgi:hypothetical protein
MSHMGAEDLHQLQRTWELNHRLLASESVTQRPHYRRMGNGEGAGLPHHRLKPAAGARTRGSESISGRSCYEVDPLICPECGAKHVRGTVVPAEFRKKPKR